ncbi:hypothetical protein MMC27_008889 [Xylographa pallens]|nr:hypothetical protein [Xylographa pallens]
MDKRALATSQGKRKKGDSESIRKGSSKLRSESSNRYLVPLHRVCPNLLLLFWMRINTILQNLLGSNSGPILVPPPLNTLRPLIIAPWHVCGKELGQWKLLVRGGVHTVVDDLWIHYRLDTKDVKKLADEKKGGVRIGGFEGTDDKNGEDYEMGGYDTWHGVIVED